MQIVHPGLTGQAAFANNGKNYQQTGHQEHWTDAQNKVPSECFKHEFLPPV